MKEKNDKQKKWNMANPAGKAYLAWTLEDYEIWEEEPPDCLLQYQGKTEGQLMSDFEIEGWVSDNFKALSVLKEENSEAFERVHRDFLADLAYLNEIGKIEEELFNELSGRDIYDF